MKVKKLWGHEFIAVNTELYCLKLIVCRDNIWSSEGLYHMHIEKDETFIVVEGDLELDIDGNIAIYRSPQTVRIFPLTPHRFRSVSCNIMEVSTEDKPEDSIRGTLEDLHHRIRVHRKAARTGIAGLLWN